MKQSKISVFLCIISVCLLYVGLNPQIAAQGKVAYSIKIISQPKDASGVIGETITLSVEASGENLQYSWLYNYWGEYDSESTYDIVSEYNNTGEQETLKILLTKYLANGIFWCRITDENGNQIDTQPCRITLNQTGALPDSMELAGPSPEDIGETTIWDCVWFGTYPQREVTGSDLTDSIKDADYNELNDATVEGMRYRRLKCNDDYRYFLYEPIKWRVLETKDGKAFLLSDILLDEHDYEYVAQFLNGYIEPAMLYTNGISAGIDNFKDTAFNSNEQEAIITEDIDSDRATPIFSLERSDLSKQHGFTHTYWGGLCNEWMRTQISHYARVWINRDCENNPDQRYYYSWWMNTVAEGTNVYVVSSNGDVSTEDYTAYYTHNKGIRPALWLDLDNASVWQYAGFVKSADSKGINKEIITELPCKINGGNDRKEQIIQLSNTMVEMTYGETNISLGATASGDLDYYSADPSVVEVSENGNLTAIKPGKTTVTILAKSTAQYNSTVLEVPVKVEKAEAELSVAQTNMELTYGSNGQGQIDATTQSDAPLQYESLDESIVSTSYSNGTIGAYKQGETQVRVFQEETPYYKAAEIYVNVKVNRGKSAITGLQSNYEVNCKDKTVSFAFQKIGNNKTKATVSDSSIAYISKSPYEAKTPNHTNYQIDVKLRKAGIVTITLTNEETDQYEGSSASFTLTVVDDNLNNNPNNDLDDEESLVDGDEFISENQKYTVFSSMEHTLLYSGPTDKNIISVDIPEIITKDGKEYKVVKIEEYAFKNCQKLKKVTLPKTLISIGARAFYQNTSLTQITIPANVKTIGAKAFYGCKKLKRITIKTSKLTSKRVGAKAFKGIARNSTIKVPKNKLKIYRTLLKKKGITGKKQKINC